MLLETGELKEGGSGKGTYSLPSASVLEDLTCETPGMFQKASADEKSGTPLDTLPTPPPVEPRQDLIRLRHC